MESPVHRTPELESRFWSKVSKEDGCWPWLSRSQEDKHCGARRGLFRMGGDSYFAHRVSYWLHYERWPGEFLVCHKCDNPICVNPEHLFLGTNADNQKDCADKGRGNNEARPGMSHPMRKLTREDVEEILTLRKHGHKYKELAERFSVSFQQISKIVLGLRWNSGDSSHPSKASLASRS